jgi:hypothetical protein
VDILVATSRNYVLLENERCESYLIASSPELERSRVAATKLSEAIEQSSVGIPKLCSFLSSSLCRKSPCDPAHGQHPSSTLRQAHHETPILSSLLKSSASCPKHLYTVILALSCSSHLQPIQSSRAGESFSSHMARRRRRGEIWRGTLREYVTRKQNEDGVGRHMSARAEPQGRSGG